MASGRAMRRKAWERAPCGGSNWSIPPRHFLQSDTNHYSGIVGLIPADGDRCWVGGKECFEETQSHSDCGASWSEGVGYVSSCDVPLCLSMEY